MTDQKPAAAEPTFTKDDVAKMMSDLAQGMRADFAKQLETMAAAVPVNTPADLSALGPVFEKMSMSIAELTDQNAGGSAPKRLAPAEIQARAAAFERMGSLLTAVQQKPSSEWPIYKLVAKTQVSTKETGPRILDPIVSIGKNEWAQVRIRHPGIPNLAMRPDNDSAKAIYREYVRYLGGSETANRIAPASPAWMTHEGTVIMGMGTQSAQAHGRQFEAEPITIDGEDLAGQIARRNAEITDDMLIPNDPRAKQIHVLGTLAPPATTGMTKSNTV